MLGSDDRTRLAARSFENATRYFSENATRYFRNLDILRSARGLPPVWQVGQY